MTVSFFFHIYYVYKTFKKNKTFFFRFLLPDKMQIFSKRATIDVSGASDAPQSIREMSEEKTKTKRILFRGESITDSHWREDDNGRAGVGHTRNVQTALP